MRRLLIVLAVVATVLLLAPGWTGEERLALLRPGGRMHATRVGALTFLGGVHLTSGDPAFGGFSALDVRGDRFTLLSDGGNIVRFRMGADWRPRGVVFGNLPSGPGTGWQKRQRDSESLAVDPATGRAWIGFERSNSIWRFSPGLARAEAHAWPRQMKDWEANGGAESLARMPDGRFVAISETTFVPREAWAGTRQGRALSRDALIFAGDPAEAGTRVRRFAYAPYGKYDPADATALPNGDLLVLDRRFQLPFHWSNRLSLVPAGEIRPGRVVRGRLLAVLDTPLVHDNFEGVAVTREGAATIVWLVSDDNQMWQQRSLLLKFRLEGQ